MLGLGLAFLRGTFKKTTEQFAEVGEDVKAQIVANLKNNPDKIAFDTLEITIKRGESKEVFFGIRNIFDQDQLFGLHPTCTSGIKGGDPKKITLETFESWTAKADSIDVLKMVITAQSDADIDSYACELAVGALSSTATRTQTQQGTKFTFGTGEAPYAIKKFFIKVV